MADTKIEWADTVWNPVTGCTKISEGCRNCYAERMSKRLAGRCGYPAEEPFKVTLHPEKLEEPFKWKKPKRIFVCSMADLFHDDVPDSFIEEVFAIMSVANQHTFMVLTKRPDRMLKWFTDNRSMFVAGAAQQLGHRWLLPDIPMREWWPLKNVWLGVTAENQEQADKRIPLLLQTPAAVRFVSVEPMIGAVDLTRVVYDRVIEIDALNGLCGWPRAHAPFPDGAKKLNWIICGGETGPGARPLHPDWVRSLRDQCRAANVSFFFKQWGEWGQNGPVTKDRIIARPGGYLLSGDVLRNKGDMSLYRIGKKNAGRLLDGRTWEEFPEVEHG